MLHATVSRFALTVLSAGLLVACGGGSSSTPTPVSPTPTPTPTPDPITVTLSGKATFDRVPNSATTNSLNYAATFQSPIRFAPVELVDSAGSIIETTTSDTNGDYSFSLQSGQSVRVRVKSEITRTTENAIDLQIVDNTSGNAVYAVQGALSDMPRSDQVRDLNAASGWGGSGYTGDRAGAPFALLDTVYMTMEDIIAIDADVDFPRLDVYWSPDNRAESGDVALGQIGTSSYTRTNGVPVIRILGDADSDTDEYDSHVVVHEFGHYFENTLSRADSIGGSHSESERLDARVAFGEGWGNALSGMILDDPLYRDSFGADQSSGFSLDVENNTYASTGWYSEGSVQSILYDLFDSANDGVDTFGYGLAPIYDAFVSNAYRESEAFTSIFNFVNALEVNGDVTASDLTALLDAQDINSLDPFGLGETNDGGLPDQLPVYLPVPTNGTAVEFCSVDEYGFYNKHGNRRFLTFDIAAAGLYDFEMSRISGPAGADPDFIVYSRGQPVASALSSDVDVETTSVTLQAGTYVVEASDYRNVVSTGNVDSCFDFTLQ